ncbi:MAG: glycine-rich domain-containing protein [Dehalococcoidia bacterium]
MLGAFAVGSAILLLLGGARLVFAHGGNTAAVHSCVNRLTGWVRIIPADGSCLFGEKPLDWNQQGPAGEVRGLQEYSSSGNFVVPAGVTRILVELVGGGGGGGGDGEGGGGGGGAGAYARGVLPVTPGASCTITVGLGGPGATSPDDGTGGGTSIVDCGASATVQAGGGSGGTHGPTFDPADAGEGGDGGSVTLSPGLAGQFVAREGEDGGDNLESGVLGGGGVGGRANPITMPFVGTPRGDGGKGGIPDVDIADTDGKPGQPGWVLIQW